jgi:hypothetical protein
LIFLSLLFQDDSASVISFTSSIHSLNDTASTSRRLEDMDTKIELVSLMGCSDIDKMAETFLAMSSSPANCDMMRNHRVVPLLVQMLHNTETPHRRDIKYRVAKTLHNIVHAHPEHKQCKREGKVLRILEILRMYSDYLRDLRLAGDSGDALRVRGCGPLRMGVAYGAEGQPILLCGKLKYS